jgi:hypothetical protein
LCVLLLASVPASTPDGDLDLFEKNSGTQDISLSITDGVEAIESHPTKNDFRSDMYTPNSEDESNVDEVFFKWLICVFCLLFFFYDCRQLPLKS